MRYLFNLVMALALGLWVLNSSSLGVGGYQAAFYSKFLKDKELKDYINRQQVSAIDKLSKKEIDDYYRNSRMRQREMSRRIREDNLRIRNKLRDDRARQKSQRRLIKSQNIMAKNIRLQQSQFSSSTNKSYRDLIISRQSNR